MKTNRIIFEAAEPVVATWAKERSHFAGYVIMVYGQLVCLACAWVPGHDRVPANGARSILLGKHAIKVSLANAVVLIEVLIANFRRSVLGVPFACSAVAAIAAQGITTFSLVVACVPAKGRDWLKAFAVNTSLAGHVAKEVGRWIRRIVLHRNLECSGARARLLTQRVPSFVDTILPHPQGV